MADDRDEPQYKLRLTVEMRYQLKLAADRNKRSLNSEILSRLDSTFHQMHPISLNDGSSETIDTTEYIRLLNEIIETQNVEFQRMQKKLEIVEEKFETLLRSAGEYKYPLSDSNGIALTIAREAAQKLADILAGPDANLVPSESKRNQLLRRLTDLGFGNSGAQARPIASPPPRMPQLHELSLTEGEENVWEIAERIKRIVDRLQAEADARSKPGSDQRISAADEIRAVILNILRSNGLDELITRQKKIG